MLAHSTHLTVEVSVFVCIVVESYNVRCCYINKTEQLLCLLLLTTRLS